MRMEGGGDRCFLCSDDFDDYDDYDDFDDFFVGLGRSDEKWMIGR